MPKKTKIQLESDLLLPKQREAVCAAADQIYDLMRSGSPSASGQPLIDVVWPALSQLDEPVDPHLVLEPMHRLGGDPGKTGNTVLAGRFFANASTAQDMLPSRAIIIKVSPETGAERAKKKRERLLDEYRTAINLKAQFSDRSRFAYPLHLYEPESADPAVLWTPLESTGRLYPIVNLEQRRAFVKILPIVNFLSAASPSHKDHTKRKEQLKRIISAADGLVEAHFAKGANYHESVNLITHYEWELRGFHRSDDWAKPWLKLWGTTPQVSDFGDDWPNPVLVFKELQQLGKLSLRMGFVHGDLHPRNIVFANDDTVRVIDFGWARPSKPDDPLQHIVKDFVLLEANLRFMTLPPFLPFDSVKDFADWIGMDDTPPCVDDQECKLRFDLVKQLRKVAQEHVGKCNDWDVEYVVPLFLVSLGLLKHSCSADCPWAARYTVLMLARYLKNKLKL